MRFVFGALVDTGFSFVVNVLPIIVFMGSMFAVLYHLGVMQRVVNVLAAALSRTLGTSGAESLAAVANVFVGMTESALVVRPISTDDALGALQPDDHRHVDRGRLGDARLRPDARRRRLRRAPGHREPDVGAGRAS